ncbi:MAG: hypothetical protein ACI9J3_002084 [Parvicellaceae bacterium]|jgi:hypothetical protein
MSYDIYFINDKTLKAEEISSALELEVAEGDQLFISKELMLQIQESMISKGLKFEVFESADGSLEWNFASFQVSVFDSMGAISVPYWNANESDSIQIQVALVKDAFFDNGLIGFDPQTEEIFTTSVAYSTEFSTTMSWINKSNKNEIRSDSNNVQISIEWAEENFFDHMEKGGHMSPGIGGRGFGVIALTIILGIYFLIRFFKKKKRHHNN